MTPSTLATIAVRACVREALRSEVGAPVRFGWPVGLSVDDFVAAVTRQRVAHVIADNLPCLELPEEASARLVAQRDRGTMRSLVQTRELGRVSKVLSSAGVDFLAFKGPALALLSTGRLDSRGFGDLDLFVAPSRAADAHRALVGAGWAPGPDFPAPGPSWAWRHLIKHYYEMPFVAEHSRIDLHWWLAPTRTALPDFASAWSRRVRLSIAGVSVMTLGVEDTFAHTCSHAAKDDWRWLRSLVDVHRLARNPELWRGREPGRVELMSLAATRDSIGLPTAVSGQVHAQLDGHGRVVRRARRQQQLPFPPRDPLGFPGAGIPDAIVRSVRGGRQPREVARVAWHIVVPSGIVADLPDRGAGTAVPKAVGRRATRHASKLYAWSRRG